MCIDPMPLTGLDYEGEMGFIIGKECRHVPYDQAASCIYGYTVVNDFTIRDWQFRGPPHTMTMGKILGYPLSIWTLYRYC